MICRKKYTLGEALLRFWLKILKLRPKRSLHDAVAFPCMIISGGNKIRYVYTTYISGIRGYETQLIISVIEERT